ncbi:hypothetical protein M0811_13000 [Anaeramoeba ignava]|uniref:Transmembrane protein n=1 Tax=Anaeramoeba ignava TaxID=1746090 RepID=A0A9Q0L7L8_ANAIG|nr:hypothetical protein M0811_13000 [Anaeramoeba ignava]
MNYTTDSNPYNFYNQQEPQSNSIEMQNVDSFQQNFGQSNLNTTGNYEIYNPDFGPRPNTDIDAAPYIHSGVNLQDPSLNEQVQNHELEEDLRNIDVDSLRRDEVIPPPYVHNEPTYNAQPPKKPDEKKRKRFRVFTMIVLGGWGVVLYLLIAWVFPGGYQQNKWDINTECNVTYTPTEKTAVYRKDNGNYVNAKIVDPCKPKFSSSSIQGERTCWIHPKDEEKVRIFPLWKFAYFKVAVAFTVIILVLTNIPFLIYDLVKSEEETKFYIIHIPFMILIFPIMAIVLMFVYRKKAIIFPIIFLIYFDMILFGVILLPAIKEGKKYDLTECLVTDAERRDYCPYCGSILSLTCTSLFSSTSSDSYSDKRKPFVTVIPDNYAVELNSSSVYYPWVLYDFGTSENSIVPDVGDKITCWTKKDYELAAAAPKTITKLPNKSSQYKAATVAIIVISSIWGFFILIRLMISKP